jgi:rare lipoprotein A
MTVPPSAPWTVHRPPARHGRGAAALFALFVAAGCSTVPVDAPPASPPAASPATSPATSPGPAAASPGPPPAADAPAAPSRPAKRPPARTPAAPRASRGGGYYLDDGPGDNPPRNLDSIPDAVPRAEPLHPAANRPYRVFGQSYVPRPELSSHRERGYASWYGRKFHGRPTSSGERYDMYGMTAAHPTLPIPSYVRVTNVRNGRTVVLRVNDRGPFLNRRVIDLSYTAAHRLGYVDSGSAEVEVELLQAGGAAPRPVQTAVRADLADQARQEPPPVAPASLPMLAEAAAERLSIETTIDDQPLVSVVPVVPVVHEPGASLPVPGVAVSPAERALSPAPPAAPALWLQLGAFASRDNAEAARSRFSRELPWLGVPIDIIQLGETWRVQAGPWARRDDAVATAERIVGAGSVKPITVLR